MEIRSFIFRGFEGRILRERYLEGGILLIVIWWVRDWEVVRSRDIFGFFKE